MSFLILAIVFSLTVLCPNSSEATNNNLTELPTSFGLITGFLSLRLANNRLTSLPPLPKFTKLSTLDLYYNRLTSLPSFSNLTMLNHL